MTMSSKVSALRRMYGQPFEESILHEGELIHGWHVEDELGTVMNQLEFLDDDFVHIYNSGLTCPKTGSREPVKLCYEHFYIRKHGRWKGIIGFRSSPGSSRICLIEKEISRNDAACLELSSHVDVVGNALPVILALKISPAVKKELDKKLEFLKKAVSEIKNEGP
ncbi:MAG TPA: hypothetical protein DCZ94_05340 [Lentisphaeria bacterium]|nr:hypothetical protein [Lentisphaeria bacterium]